MIKRNTSLNKSIPKDKKKIKSLRFKINRNYKSPKLNIEQFERYKDEL